MALPYTDDLLLGVLRSLAAELGKTPTARELAARRDLPALPTYLSHFGSWSAALKMAGLEPNQRPSYTDDLLLDVLRGLADELGRPQPTQNAGLSRTGWAN